MTLLYAFENEFQKTITNSIEDEYDMQDYYLVNKNIIEIFKDTYSYPKIKEILDKYNNNWSYKRYLKYIDNFTKNNEIKKIVLDNSKEYFDIPILDEYCFIPYKKSYDIFQYPNDFVVIPKSLFDLFYDDIDSHKKEIEKYKFNLLIGDNALFLQDSTNNNVFHVYKYNEKNDLEIICSFKYDNELLFYEEVENCIKGKGLEYYLFQRKLDIKNGLSNKIYFEMNNGKIGECIIYKQIINEKSKIDLIETDLAKNERLINQYFNMVQNIKNLESTNLKISSIKDIEKNKSNLKIIKGFIIYEPIIEYILDLLNYTEMKNLNSFPKDDNKYIQEKNEIIKKISEKPISKSHFEQVKALGENDFLAFIGTEEGKPLISFIDLELMNEINKQKYSDKKEVWLFKNNNIYFIYFQALKRLLKINFSSDNAFTAEELYCNKNPKNILIYLKKLVTDEETQKTLIKTKLKNIKKSENYYLVNKQWIEQFKNYYNYDKIKKNKNSGDDKLNKHINNLSEFPQDLLNSKKIIPEPFAYQYIQGEIPDKFEIINKNLFDSILKEININYNSKTNCKKVAFADNKIFVQNNNSQNIYYIYSLVNSHYEIDYIINLQNDVSLENLLKTIDNNETFEQFLLSKFNINFMDINPQFLLDENLNKFGDFYNMKQNYDIIQKEPNHCLGLQNIGATCYMNATIQCLCHVRKLKDYFLNRQKVYEDTNNKNCPLTIEFYKVINNLWKNSYEGKSYYTPRDFKDIISQMNPLFQGIAANDSKDLIIFLYETMHNEINKQEYQNYQAQNILNNQELANFRNDYYSKNNSLFIKTFYFEQQGELGCLNCKTNKLSYTIYNIIIFPLEKVREYMVKVNPNGFMSVKLEDCFKHYQESEILSGDNQIYCNICNQMANAANGNKLFTAPEVMTIVLNRGKGIEFDVNFEYPLRINIDKYILDKECKNNDYELICVLTHIGPSGMAGHFIAICKSPNDNKWYIYNDAQVDECIDPRNTNNKIIEGLPYVLFYQKYNKNSKDNNENIKNQVINQNNINNNINGNMLTLYFIYNDKEFYVDIDKNQTIKQIIKELNQKYGIDKKCSLYFEEGNDFIRLEDNKKIRDYPSIKNETKLTVLDS